MRAAYVHAMTGRSTGETREHLRKNPYACSTPKWWATTTTPAPSTWDRVPRYFNLRSSARSWWDHAIRGRWRRRPTLNPGGGPRLGTLTPFPHTFSLTFPSQSGCIAMRLLSFARHKWPSKDDGRETLGDAAGAPPGFPLVPKP